MIKLTFRFLTLLVVTGYGVNSNPQKLNVVTPPLFRKQTFKRNEKWNFVSPTWALYVYLQFNNQLIRFVEIEMKKITNI